MKRIAFIKRNPQIRILKQAKGLKSTGRYHLTLVAQRFDKEIYEGVFDKIITYGSLRGTERLRRISKGLINIDLWQLRHILRNLEVDIVHAHAEPNIIPAIAIRYAICPVVYDAYDCTSLRFGFDNVPRKESVCEKFCLENADGIVRREADIEIDYYRDAGYNIKAPVLRFSDYCLEEYIVTNPLPKLSDKDGEPHLVHAGNVCPMNLPSKRYGHAQFVDVGEILAAQKIHFHIYPNPYQVQPYPCYEQLASQTPYFHMHKPLPPFKITKEISQYDYSTNLHFTGADSIIERQWSKVAPGNRFATALEAGLPMIVNDELEYVCKLVNEYGLGIVIKRSDLGNLASIIAQADYEALQANVRKRRLAYSVRKQICRLEAFYQEITS